MAAGRSRIGQLRLAGHVRQLVNAAGPHGHRAGPGEPMEDIPPDLGGLPAGQPASHD